MPRNATSVSCVNAPSPLGVVSLRVVLSNHKTSILSQSNRQFQGPVPRKERRFDLQMQKESWENEAKPQDPILAAFGGKDGPPDLGSFLPSLGRFPQPSLPGRRSRQRHPISQNHRKSLAQFVQLLAAWDRPVPASPFFLSWLDWQPLCWLKLAAGVVVPLHFGGYGG